MTVLERVAIIGSNSFSGASFTRYCLGQGLEVLGASRSGEPASCFLPYRWLPAVEQRRFRFLRQDINGHLGPLIAALEEFRPAYVVNFAAQGMVAESWLHPEHWYQTNVVAQVRLHERLRTCGWLRKYVHVSTPEVYGSTAGMIDESAPFNPSTPYAASRAACDLHLRTYLNHYKFPVAWTRAEQWLYRIQLAGPTRCTCSMPRAPRPQLRWPSVARSPQMSAGWGILNKTVAFLSKWLWSGDRVDAEQRKGLAPQG